MREKTKLRIGIIGCGDVAKYAALFFKANPLMHLSVCCDNNLDRARLFAHRYKIGHLFSDYREVFKKDLVDVVYIAAPHGLHYEMITAAIEAKKSVLSEKPVTTTILDAQNIIRLAQKNGVKIGVNYQYRYDAGIYRLKKAAQNGLIGRIHNIRINIPWYRQANYLTGWRNNKSMAGGGTLITQGSHAIDFALWICDSAPISAMGLIRNMVYQGEVEDLALGIIELANGSVIEVCSSMIAKPEGAITAEIYASKGTVHYQNKPFPLLRSRGVTVPIVQMPGSGIFAFQRSLNAYIDWVVKDKEYLISVEETLPTLASVLSIYESSQTQHIEGIEY